RTENSLRRAIAAYYELGQLLAVPALLDRPAVSAVPVSARPLPLPGQPGFDPWCLTDKQSLPRWKRDPAARRSIDTLWRYDPDPAGSHRRCSPAGGPVFPVGFPGAARRRGGPAPEPFLPGPGGGRFVRRDPRWATLPRPGLVTMSWPSGPAPSRLPGTATVST